MAERGRVGEGGLRTQSCDRCSCKAMYGEEGNSIAEAHLTKRVHGHLHVVQVYAGLVRLHTDLLSAQLGSRVYIGFSRTGLGI